LIDILSLTNPTAFSRASRIKYFTGQIASKMKLRNLWRFDVAALLSQAGCVTIPPETLTKIEQGKAVTFDEEKMYRSHPATGHDLIVNIPRLKTVATMIRHQLDDYSEIKKVLKDPAILMGAAILKASIDYDLLLHQGFVKKDAFQKLEEKTPDCYHPEVLAILKTIPPPVIKRKAVAVSVKELRRGMVLEEDVCSKGGLLLISRGQEITNTVRLLLENHFKRGNIKETLLVSTSSLSPDEEGAT